MDLSMSALTLCTTCIFINYDTLIITVLYRTEKRYSAVFPNCNVDSGRRSHAPLYNAYEKTVHLVQKHKLQKN